MASKALTKAYNAGRAAISEPPERQTPDACPFPLGTEERVQWLQGLGDAMDERPDPGDVKAALKEARDA